MNEVKNNSPFLVKIEIELSNIKALGLKKKKIINNKKNKNTFFLFFKYRQMGQLNLYFLFK